MTEETCKNCMHADENRKDMTKNDNLIFCTRYNMFTDSLKSCKVFKQREKSNGN